MNNFRKYIGYKIKKRSAEKGFKRQVDLAAALGVDQSRVSKWETGYEFPDVENRAALSRVLDVDESFFDLDSNWQERLDASTPLLDGYVPPKGYKLMTQEAYDLMTQVWASAGEKIAEIEAKLEAREKLESKGALGSRNKAGNRQQRRGINNTLRKGKIPFKR